MAISRQERERVAKLKVQGAEQILLRVREYLGRTGMTYGDFAHRVGYAEIAVRKFMVGSYDQLAGTDLYLRAAVQEYLDQHPLVPGGSQNGRKLFETENYRLIRSYFLAAVERAEVALLYGPPGTQKTFVLEYLVAERNLQGKDDAVYVYASDDMKPMTLFRRIARAAGAWVLGSNIDRLLSNLLFRFSELPHPPAVIVDEAQHLGIHALEYVRELHDRSGCGLVLAGSHSLLENFLRGRSHLEQWLSRIDHKDPLPGLQDGEIEEIASRELSNGQPARLSAKKLEKLLRACRVDDVFFRGPDGKVIPRKYLSVRRLVKYLAQVKEQKQHEA
jgi:DNA transposition AAA+ family ATPase